SPFAEIYRGTDFRGGGGGVCQVFFEFNIKPTFITKTIYRNGQPPVTKAERARAQVPGRSPNPYRPGPRWAGGVCDAFSVQKVHTGRSSVCTASTPEGFLLCDGVYAAACPAGLR